MKTLTGAWRGIFNYPEALPATGFRATLREDAGALTGEIEEPDIHTADHSAIGATVAGQREGDHIRFVKYYDRPDEGYDTVSYEGAVAADGDEITGRWDIPGVWSGTFIMTRDIEMADIEAADGVEAHR